MNYVRSCLIITMLAGIGYADHCLGDLNCDEEVNVIDVILLLNLIMEDEYQSNADFNDDNLLDILDIVQLVNMILNN